MDLLTKQLANKENQFREMSAQLLSHIKKIDAITSEIQELESANEVLKSLISEKDSYLSNLLKQKLEYFDILEALENPGHSEFLPPDEDLSQNLPEPPRPEPEIQEEKKEELKEEEKPEEKEEEQYISDEIDITSELAKLGLVDLVKKY